jgi:hypothetical protein
MRKITLKKLNIPAAQHQYISWRRGFGKMTRKKWYDGNGQRLESKKFFGFFEFEAGLDASKMPRAGIALFG